MASSSQDASHNHKKKRKSMAVDEFSSSSGNVEVIVGSSSSSAGPAFVNFPSIRPSKSIPFTLYSRTPGSTHPLETQPTLIAGETDDVEYFSTNRDSAGGGEGKDCSYLPAVYDPSTKQLHVHPGAPLYLLSHRVKRLKDAPLPSAPRGQAAAEWRAKRNDLGEAFGTRKAKNQIKAEERNKVDVGAMEGVRSHLMETIGEKEVQEEGPVPPSESIPVPDLETDDPSKVYPRDSIIPPSEWSAINLDALLDAADDRARSAALPFRRSRFVNDKLKSTIQYSQGSAQRTTLKWIFYLSALFQFLDIAPALHKLSGSEMRAKLPGVPPQMINGLCSRFADNAGGGKKWNVTERGKTKLLAWICCTALACDGWSADVTKLAGDLRMPPAKIVDIFKSLGCKVDSPSAAKDSVSIRKAVLKAPVVFPKIKRRGPAKR